MAIRRQRDGGILTVAIDRQEAGNRLDAATVDELTREFEGCSDADSAPKAIILTAVGDTFSLGRERDPAASTAPWAIVAEFERIQRLNDAVARCPVVTIAAIRGAAEGAALSLAARCDIVVVADDAALSFPEIPHGIPPTIVLSHYRYVLPRNILGDLIFTGRTLSGPEAVSHGLAARSVSAAEVADVATGIAQQVADYDQRSVRLVKSFLQRTTSVSAADAPALGIAMYAVEMADRALAPEG